ncbi:MAG: zinc-binding dehydrogenase, partial [Vicinamibacterales bacterium]|nr:zinc-binding dehydrogenase [Vicinamibacterales bacterium]
MKAVRFHEHGGLDVLRQEEVPEPEPGPGEVLIRVRACALNHLDLWQRRGIPGVRLPHCVGSDIAGDVVRASGGRRRRGPARTRAARHQLRTMRGLSGWRGQPLAELRPGETVLILAAGSGLGQVALAQGARVIVTAGSAEKLARARELGAHEGIDHYKQDIAKEVRRFTDRRGVDVVFEHFGQATWEPSMKSLKRGGRLVTC